MSGVKMEKPASMIEWLHPVAQFPNLSILTQNNIHTVWITKSKFLKHSIITYHTKTLKYGDVTCFILKFLAW